MATVKAPFAVKGRVGNLQFYMRDGKNFVKPATFPSPLPPDYYHTHPRQLENRFRFAGAVAICSAIYSEFDDHARKVMRPYAYNLIRGRLRQMLQFAPEFWRIEFPVVHHARPVGPQLIDHPAQGTVRLFTSQYTPQHQIGIDQIAARRQKLAESQILNTDCATDISQALEGML